MRRIPWKYVEDTYMDRNIGGSQRRTVKLYTVTRERAIGGWGVSSHGRILVVSFLWVIMLGANSAQPMTRPKYE